MNFVIALLALCDIIGLYNVLMFDGRKFKS